MKWELGEVILEREFETQDADGNLGHVTLRVGRPQFVPPEAGGASSWGWYCPHQIVGIGDERVDALRGMDALDALLLSLKMADAILKQYRERYHKKITWLGEEHLGLPSLEARAEDSSDKDDFSPFEEAFNKFFEDFGKKQGKT